MMYAKFIKAFKLDLEAWFESRKIPSKLKDDFEFLRPIMLNGKFFRPFVYSMVADKNADSKLTLSIELLHLFALVHDDIIDNSDTRRGHNTIHVSLEEKYPKIGKDLAIIIGDWLLQQSYLALSKTESSLRDKYSEVFNQLIEEVTYGQIYDIRFTIMDAVSEEEISEKNILKTAHYSFTRPMLLGAISYYSSLSETQENWIEDFGSKLGLYFQTQDDLLDLNLEGNIGKPSFNDFFEGQWTLIRLYLTSKATKKEIEFMESLIAKQRNDKDILRLKDLLDKYKVVNYINGRLVEMELDIKKNIENAPDEHLRKVAADLFALVSKREK